MNMDKIIEKMKINRDEKVRESYTCKRGKYSYNDMSVFADGYSDAVKDLVNMVKSQTPPCSGSSVQSKDKFGVFIGDIVELKDGTIGELIFVEKKEEDSNLYNIGVNLKYSVFYITLTMSQFNDYFNRIGNNNFVKKDNIYKLKLDFKKVTEPSTITTVDGKGNATLEFNKMTELFHKKLPTNEELMNKINEIIDYINKEDK